jgi:hypothetical protein
LANYIPAKNNERDVYFGDESNGMNNIKEGIS